VAGRRQAGLIETVSVDPNLEHSTTFGREEVTPEERDRRMRETFRRLAPGYDRLCDVMTLGIHHYWRRVFNHMVNLKPGQRMLDVAGGCGETAIPFAAPDRQVIILDPSLPMMKIGRSRSDPSLQWVAAVARALPFPDDSMDVVTMSFGLRNVTFVRATLEEVLRVLKPGGRFLCLEVSRPWFLLKPFHDAFARYAVPWLGARIIRAPDVFDYLVESIHGFPAQEQIKGLMERIGFVEVRYQNLSFGTAAIHAAVKPSLGHH
jgi:demethylmenaquinone methyltransferase/2-methoxy-6-polyprenyl-1,4-benzoquinol methylase